MSNDWQPFTGDYDKIFYEVRKGQSGILQHFWPNAGRLFGSGGWQLNFGERDGVEFRPYSCETCRKFSNGVYSPERAEGGQ